MTDHPASWLADPTGRHDHRYWDGDQWTDHVADAGVAATDPYDGPADATPGSPGTTAASTSPSGWGWGSAAEEPAPTTPAAPADPAPSATPSVSGWGATTGDAADRADDAPAEPDPAPSTASTWGAPVASTSDAPTGWGAPPISEPHADEPVVEEPLAAQGAVWGAAPVVADPLPVQDDPTEVVDAPTQTWSAAPSTTWGAPLPTTPTAEPTVATTDGEGRSRKGLVLVLALLAIVGIVVALAVTGDDKGSDTDGGTFASRFATQLKGQTSISQDQADCVGEYVVDEIGPSRLEGVQSLEDRTVPPELQADLNQAVQRALTECDIDQQDLLPPSSSTDAAIATDGTDATGDTVPPAETMTASQYQDYFQSTLGLSEEDARCLAERSAEAASAGEVDQGAGVERFYQWVEECGIDADEMFQTIATAGIATDG